MHHKRGCNKLVRLFVKYDVCEKLTDVTEKPGTYINDLTFCVTTNIHLIVKHTALIIRKMQLPEKPGTYMHDGTGRSMCESAKHTES